jgi:hypothetical protein
MNAPSGEKQSAATVALCALSSSTHAPVAASHTCTAALLLPASPAARRPPSGDHATQCSAWLLVLDRSCCSCWLLRLS